MLPLRLVIDTNVLVSAAIKPTGLQRTVFLIAISKPARLYVSYPILEEYTEVLARPELRIRKGSGCNCCSSSRTTVIPCSRPGSLKRQLIPMTIYFWNAPTLRVRTTW
jgi:hypothetical protein